MIEVRMTRGEKLLANLIVTQLVLAPREGDPEPLPDPESRD